MHTNRSVPQSLSGRAEWLGLKFTSVTDKPEVGLFGVKLTDNALLGDLNVSRFTCPTWRQTVKVDRFRIADQPPAIEIEVESCNILDARSVGYQHRNLTWAKWTREEA
jgi:hypothetical protein